jgi:hypothetical protein
MAPTSKHYTMRKRLILRRVANMHDINFKFYFVSIQSLLRLAKYTQYVKGRKVLPVPITFYGFTNLYTCLSTDLIILAYIFMWILS